MEAPSAHTPSNWPRISIITPTYMQGQYIEECLGGILDQGYANLELIIIDGGSTDETVDILHAYNDRISYWVSEADRGQSHAINKGVEKASGDVIQWINSDDVMLPGSLEAVARAFQANPNAQMIAGKTVKFGEGKSDQLVPRWKDHPTMESFLFNFWYMQPSCFFRGDAFRSLMPINDSLHYTMDTDLFVRFFLKYGRESVVHLDESLLRFRMHDDSKSFSAQLGFTSERAQIDLNVLASLNCSSQINLSHLIEKEIDLNAYDVAIELNKQALCEAFELKWKPWQEDRSKRYREVAEYAGLHGDRSTMRRYAWRAIIANPLKVINYRYWFATFKA